MQHRPESELNEILIRKSQWKHWKLCPQLYNYIWLKHYPSEPGVEQNFGQLFHYNAKVFFDGIDDQKLLTAPSVLEYFEEIAEPALQHPVIGKWMRNFIVLEESRWKFIAEHAREPLKFWKPVATELFVLSKLRGFEMHIDRIDRLSNGNLVVFDYKTDKYWNISSLRAETAFYNVGINSSGRFDEPCTHIGCINPQVNRWFVEECKPRLIALVNRSVLQFRRAIVSGDFKPRPQRYCRYCSQNSRCLEEGVFKEEFIA